MTNRLVALAAGASILLAGMAIGAESTTFRVTYPTDPVGPAGFPLLAAALLALGGLTLLLEGGIGERVPEEESVPVWAGGARVIWACLAFAGYAVLLPLLGFVPATSMLFAALATLFGGRPRDGLLAGAVVAVVLFALFVWGLGLALPVWPLGGSP
jgi:putative tricarboxylic transport membrane protein